MFRYLQKKTTQCQCVRGWLKCPLQLGFMTHLLVFDSWLTATVIISVCVSPSKGSATSVTAYFWTVSPCFGKPRSNLQRPCESPFPWGGLDKCFCLKWGFLGATWDVTVSWTDSRWHCARPQSRPGVLHGPAAFWTYYLKVFLFISRTLSLLYSFFPRCNWICKVRYFPLEPIHLWVLWSFCHSFSHHVFLSLPPLRQMALTQVSHLQSPLIWLTSLSQWGH